MDILTGQNNDASLSYELKLSVVLDMANTYLQQRQYQRALVLYKEVLKVGMHFSNPKLIDCCFRAMCYKGMGTAHHRLEQLQQALDLLKKSLELTKKCLPVPHPITLERCYILLGDVYCDLRQYSMAITQYKKALDIKEDEGEEIEDMRSIFERLSLAYTKIGNLTQARRFEEQATPGSGRMLLINEVTYICPRCKESVSIYSAFRFINGFPCFQCVVHFLMALFLNIRRRLLG